jgi:hypothetical protein
LLEVNHALRAGLFFPCFLSLVAFYLLLMFILSSPAFGQELSCSSDPSWQTLQQDLTALKENMTLLVQSNTECKNDSKAINSELESLKQELAELKTKLEGNKDCSDDAANLETKLSELFKKEFTDFAKKLSGGA